MWVLSGKEDDIKLKEKQIEVTFFQQIMLNELDKVAVYLDVSSSRVIFSKNMRYLDPYVSNNDFEELYIKSYSIYDVKIHTNGSIECDFIQEYKKAENKFNKYYTKKCHDEELKRQRIKKEEDRKKVQAQETWYEQVRNSPRNNEIKFEVEPHEEIKRYFTGNISYKYKLKNAINGKDGAVKEVVKHIIEWGYSDDSKIITLICKYHYINGNKKVKEVYEEIMREAGLASVSLEEDEHGKQLECPIL